MIGISGRSSRVGISSAFIWKERLGIGVHRPSLNDLYLNYSPESEIDPERVRTGSRARTTSINLTDKQKIKEQRKLLADDKVHEELISEKLFNERLSRARKRRRFYMSVIMRRGF